MAKPLGADEYPVFTYRAMVLLAEPTKRVCGREWPNLIGGNDKANPASTIRAMADATLCTIRAFVSLGNNTSVALANSQQTYERLLKQDLIVVHEHMLVPTAQRADYVLPGDARW